MYPADYCDYLFYTEVYPKDGRIDSRRHEYSWELFQIMVARRKKFQFGISFAFDLVTPENLEESAGSLNALRSAGIRHYGLLTVLAFPVDYNLKVSNARAIIAKLKKLQGSDWTAKTVLAFGTYEYSEYFMPTIKAVFTDVAKLIPVVDGTHAVILFEPVFHVLTRKPCEQRRILLKAVDQESHWFAVSARTTFLNPSIITGLSFELSALKYVMEKIPASLNDSVFQPCLSVKKSGREAVSLRYRTGWQPSSEDSSLDAEYNSVSSLSLDAFPCFLEAVPAVEPDSDGAP
ncbi:hypothetical protein HPB51_011332 [Rhipicephalus microplus]|uniref:Uncharacterized protein n=1 Tax=Rhipicephalus microplus TaxID=6941 RepID=A0A9J6E7Y7_RHIMP|nr:hypothetical protein HPB51_011332 [Rhipicephalus microplus]